MSGKGRSNGEANGRRTIAKHNLHEGLRRDPGSSEGRHGLLHSQHDDYGFREERSRSRNDLRCGEMSIHLPLGNAIEKYYERGPPISTDGSRVLRELRLPNSQTMNFWYYKVAI